VVKAAVFAVPGDLATPTGGFAYDARMISELKRLGWRIEVVDLGNGFPQPSAHARAAACAQLKQLAPPTPVVVDGLALGVLPEAAWALRKNHCLVALVHHPLALEAGWSSDEAAAFHRSERSALACARHVVVTSAATARLLAADYDVAPDRVSVVEPGTDRIEAAANRGGTTVTLLAVGSVIPRKGYDVLVAALARLEHLPWQLVIAGDCVRSPMTTRQLKDDIARHGLGERINLCGAVASGELAKLYAAADLFVLPSRFEGYGMACAEAISHGLPVIATTVGAIPETVPADAGVLLPPDDVEALAQVLRWLIETPQARDRLAAGARATSYPSWRSQASLFARVLDKLA
jgi:glycosyltransferase involved in cell wall biosynthesis